ncbi:TIGR01777 family oxidoreductase [Alicyclobacillus tolerans]|uniref:TIGR01777 family oxidoreductase n=1 Tax=Alicyclobacillus tolerans TaxID=90970 RepID=UPI001F01BCFA|nr:TIGR01777 family oxidoreductase [Alicyclobacillus tolerans]MCF8566761.1 TIGR01777 family oxidoreductase [Alicyclobacillus tolerans]
MNVIVLGGSGLIGQHLAKRLLEADYQVWIGSRRKVNPPYGIALAYEPEHMEKYLRQFSDHPYAIVNLAGAPISKRWTPEHQKRILDSRIVTTQAVVESLGQLDNPPQVLINASAIGFYGYSDYASFTEKSTPGQGFLPDVTKAWEKAAAAAKPITRVVTPRFGLVLAADGGALPRMLLPYHLFAGGRVGAGSQWLSWVHIDDVVEILTACLENPQIQGPVNVTAPTPVTMQEFGRTAARVLGRPYWLPVPAFALRLLLGKMSELVLDGQKVYPEKMLRYGYRFQFPELQPALTHILSVPHST